MNGSTLVFFHGIFSLVKINGTCGPLPLNFSDAKMVRFYSFAPSFSFCPSISLSQDGTSVRRIRKEK